MSNLRQIKQAIKADPGNAEHYMVLGDHYFRQREYAKAAEALARAVSINPENATAHCHLGACLSYLGHHEKAEGYYRTAVELEPTFPPARENLGGSLLVQQRFAEAVEVLEESLLIGAHTALVYGRLAEIYMHQGQSERAEWYAEQFKQAAAYGHPDCPNIVEMASTVEKHVKDKIGMACREFSLS